MDPTTPLPEFNSDQVTNVAFSWYDYTFFSTMLGLSVAIGIYYGFFGKNNNNAEEYLLGGHEMKVFPISMSLVASHISGISLLAFPADIYRFGISLALSLLPYPLVGWLTAYVYLPVYFNLGITSTYEYLEKRFDKRTRTFASFLFGLAMFLYLPIVIYIPALAFSAATGFDVHIVAPLVCGICIFYTTIGGLKAVVWTDTLQFTVTIGAVATVFVMGVHSAGGFGNILKMASQGDRFIIDYSLDPTSRDSIWIISLGSVAVMISHLAANQSCVQKYLAVPTLKDAQRCVIYFVFGMIIVQSTTLFIGLIMYARYAHCDPFSTGIVKRNDQLLPYYVMDVAASIPGLPGLFIAGVFSTALSTLSACLNCLAGTIFEDFVCKYISKKTEANHSGFILKALVVIIGVVCTAFVFVIERMGGIISLCLSLTSVTAGPLFAIFTMGVLMPKINKKGAYYGTIIATIFIGIYVCIIQYYKSLGYLSYESKPFFNDQCENNSTLPLSSSQTFDASPEKPDDNDLFILFRITFFVFSLLAGLLAILLASIISFFTEKDPPVHKDLLSPLVHFMLPKEQREYYTVENALNLIKCKESEEFNQ